MFTAQSHSVNLPFDDLIRRLTHSPHVQGIALFGSRNLSSPAGDYDLLLVVSNPPLHIFQMLTHIAHRTADVVFVDSAVVKRVLQLDTPVHPMSAEAMFVRKIFYADILYDGEGEQTGLLERARQHLQTRQRVDDWLLPPAESERYADWFWLNHGLHHAQRMAQSDNLVHLLASDMMLLNALSMMGRAYYRIRGLHWDGEKAFIRYVEANDSAHLVLYRQCLEETDRTQKLVLARELVERTAAPFVPLWHDEVTALFLAEPSRNPDDVEAALAYWEQLVLTDVTS